MISSYHDMDSGVVLKNYFEVIANRLSILGFIVIDAIPKAEEVSYHYFRASPWTLIVLVHRKPC